jgi:MYXO-CTERM domain-containing protein
MVPSTIVGRRGRWIEVAVFAALLLNGGSAFALTTTMVPFSGGDGTFDTVTDSGMTIYQSTSSGNGTYSSFMYFQRPAGVTFTAGATLYVEVDYKDIGGPGRFGLQYNATGNDFADGGFGIDAGVQTTGAYKTAVFRLDNNAFHDGENGGNDMRLTQSGPLQLHIAAVRVSDSPTALYTSLTAFLGPYTGPSYAGGTPVDASTMAGKLLCGYQAWFRTPGDEDVTGWTHYIPDAGGVMTPAKIAVDYWPEMTELGPAEQYPATGFTNIDGSPATLFSSDDARTVLRHFQWMEAYGIDGVALQRFFPGPGVDIQGMIVMNKVRAAANQTGRTFFVEYDMTGAAEADLVPTITRDWHYLVDTMKMSTDARYLHEGGLPVIGVYGFFEERFSATTANAILDIFATPGPYQAFVAGAGAWYWSQQPYSAAWQTMMFRMGSYQPWNTGNSGGKAGDVPSTAYWAADQATLAAHNVKYVPQIYPGSSSFNRDGMPWGPATEDRLMGDFLWSQMSAAVGVHAYSVFLGMFDEMDEGTQIFKVSPTPPTQAHFRDYQGLPSDYYLCLAGKASAALKVTAQQTPAKPDCAALTQPTIPDAIAPLNGAMVSGPEVNYQWTAALALGQGGTVDHYELSVDGVVSQAAAVGQSIGAGAGQHVWRVRALNSLGNAGGWSVAQTFVVGACNGGACGGGGGTDGGSGGGTGSDGGTSPTGNGKGHGGCDVAGSNSRSNGLFSLLALALLAASRRRVRRNR